jgi:hypothetical protein
VAQGGKAPGQAGAEESDGVLGRKLGPDQAAESHSSLPIPDSFKIINCSLTLIFSP